MSTIMTGLAMQDQVTRVLSGITSSLQLTLSAMDDMQKTMDKTFDSKTVDAARRSIQQTEAAIKALPPPIDKAEKEQSKFNKTIERGEEEASELLKTILGFAGAYLSFQTIKGFLTDSWFAASGRSKAEQRLQTIMSNINGMTQDGIDMLKLYAQELEATTRVGADVGIFGMSQLGEYVYDPNNIKALTKSMYNLATETYGVAFSQEQLMQTANLMGKVMMGDINALSRNGFKIDAIFSEAEQKMLKFGTEAQKTALVVKMIEENQKGLAEAMANTPEGKLHGLRLAYGAIQEKIGFGLLPVLDKFYALVLNNSSGIEQVLLAIFYHLFAVFEQLIEYAGIAASYLSENWSWIEPILWGIGGALGALATAVSVLTIKWAILNMVTKLNPFILIISLLIALGTWLYKTWQTNDEFAAGVMRAWNAMLNFFDTIPAYFWQLVELMAKPFLSWAQTIGKVYDAVINSIIAGINAVLSLVNKVTGSSYEIEAKFKMEDIANQVLDYAGAQKDAAYAKAAIKAAEREKGVLDMLEDRAAKRAQQEANKADRFKAPSLVGTALPKGDWGIDSLDSIGSVGEVGKIRDSVDISSEDLKLMREYAEQQNIQNFVTLKPTVQVTGDNHYSSGYDIDTVIARINRELEEGLASTARASWNV